MTETDVLSPTELLATSYTYDNVGQLKSKTDKNKKTTYYDYDDLGRLLTVTAPASSITHYAYDSRDNLISHHRWGRS